jgi:hypothetical protein
MIAGVQNKTGAISLLSLSPLPPLEQKWLKLVCIVNTHPPHAQLLQTTDQRPQTTDYRLQTKN